MKNQVIRNLKSKGFWRYRLRNLVKYVVVTTIVILLLHVYYPGTWRVDQKFLFAVIYGLFIGIVEDVLNFTNLRSVNSSFRFPLRLVFLTLTAVITVLAIQLIYRMSDDTPGVQFVEISSALITENSRLAIILSVAFVIIMLSELELIVGQSFFIDYFTGKFKKPRKENRAFMFLDLKDSTTITEVIGDERYNNFINDCYYLLSMPVAKTGADIVKYIGDEVILTWPMNSSRDASRCLDLYYQFKFELAERRKYFEDKYGFFPRFKAGVHSGVVVTSYIGHVKKQRDFTGDVMNTTARIVGKCNEYEANLLCSKSFFDKTSKLKFAYEVFPNVVLKGKEVQVDIVKIKGIREESEDF